MASKNKSRAARPRRTAIVPRIVFQTVVAVSVVPAVGLVAGCGNATTGGNDAASTLGDTGFSVADAGPPPNDAGFSVALPLDGSFSVAAPLDGGFSVAAPVDGGFFGVAAPLDGAFAVLVFPGDSSTNA